VQGAGEEEGKGGREGGRGRGGGGGGRFEGGLEGGTVVDGVVGETLKEEAVLPLVVEGMKLLGGGREGGRQGG